MTEANEHYKQFRNNLWFFDACIEEAIQFEIEKQENESSKLLTALKETLNSVQNLENQRPEIQDEFDFDN